jgi:ribosomal protein S18 acetylase RimI-like enzyme
MPVQLVEFDFERDSRLYVEGYCQAFRESYPGVGVTASLEASFRESLANFESLPGLKAFTALEDEPLGFIVTVLSDFAGIRQMNVESIYVAEEARGAGVAQALLAKAADLASAKGAMSVRLDVSANNTAAIKAYVAAGFVVTRHQMERLTAL